MIVTANTQFRHLSVHGSYTFNEAKSDTQGVNYVPSVAQDPGLDYGRASFGITNRLFLLGTYSAPHGIVFAPLLAAQSGTPYNLVIGNDLTANNQFNARPTYGTCGAANVVSTPYGCLDTDPVGKGERIIPYGAGLGPANFVMHMRVSKVIGIGPRIEGSKGAAGMQGGNGSVNGRGLSGGQAQPKLDATVSRKYSLTLIGGALNIFNIVNLGTPNGTLEFTALRQNAIPCQRSLRITDTRQPRCFCSGCFHVLGANFGKEPRYLTGSVVEAGRSMGVPRPGE